MKNPFIFQTNFAAESPALKQMNRFIIKWYITIGSLAFIAGYFTGKV